MKTIIQATCAMLLILLSLSAQTPTLADVAQDPHFVQAAQYLKDAGCYAGTLVFAEAASGPNGIRPQASMKYFAGLNEEGEKQWTLIDVDLFVKSPQITLTELRRAKVCPGGINFSDIPPYQYKAPEIVVTTPNVDSTPTKTKAKKTKGKGKVKKLLHLSQGLPGAPVDPCRPDYPDCKAAAKKPKKA